MDPLESEGQEATEIDNQSQLIEHKKSLCRFYLRGTCVLQKAVCRYSHGVDDLQFAPYAGEPIIWSSQRTKSNQVKGIYGAPIYKILFEYQEDKKFTLEEINSNRNIKTAIRDKMMKEECEKFLGLLRTTYGQKQLESGFVQREFTRAGFNKPTLTINFKKIVSYLSGPDSKYFAGKIGKKDVLILRRTDEEIEEYFGNLIYQFVMKSKAPKIQQNDLKKQLFVAKSDQHPPLNAILKEKQIPFIDYVNDIFSINDKLREYVCNNEVCIVGDADVGQLTVTALKYLEEGPKVIPLQKFLDHIMEAHKTNNLSLVTPLKHIILEHGYKIFYLPMVAFIYNQKSHKNVIAPQCPCQFQQEPDLSFFTLPEQQPLLQQTQIVDSEESFERCLPGLISSKVLAVDIEGRLRKGGHIEVIQFNNGQNIFLFDIYKITQISFDFDLLEAVKLAVRKVMLDDNILKIFHDSRHDCLALHDFMNTCTRNVFDTSGMEVIINQMETYSQQIPKDSTLINKLANVKTPGLNDLFLKYKAPHGINSSKQKFHSMMAKSNGSIFHLRPFDQEYKEYCVKDVLDLIYLRDQMSKLAPKQLVGYVGNHYVINSYQATL